MICVANGVLKPMPLSDIINPETQKTEIRFVDIDSDNYKIARNYMVRIEKHDFEDPAFIKKMVEVSNMSEEEFMTKFEYLGGLK